jgi:hypothetical protein
MNQKNSKLAMTMSFNWIFAIIAGIAILFFAVYFASQFIKTGEQAINTQTAAKLSGLLESIETGFASGKKPEEINFKRETRTFYTCSEIEKPFGKQTLAFSEKSLNNEYGSKSSEIAIKNKHIFSQNTLEGEKLLVFAKPFSIGFAVSDIIVVSNENYCFYQAPNIFKDELRDMSNINFAEDFDECIGIKVCFSEKTGCDIIIKGECADVDCEDYDYGTIINKKKGYSAGYIGNLVYGAIFSSKEIYECNVKRLMSKFNELGKIYLEKNIILEKKGCVSNIEAELRNLMDSCLKIKSSRELSLVYDNVKSIEIINMDSAGGCRLF